MAALDIAKADEKWFKNVSVKKQWIEITFKSAWGCVLTPFFCRPLHCFLSLYHTAVLICISKAVIIPHDSRAQVHSLLLSFFFWKCPTRLILDDSRKMAATQAHLVSNSNHRPQVNATSRKSLKTNFPNVNGIFSNFWDFHFRSDKKKTKKIEFHSQNYAAGAPLNSN